MFVLIILAGFKMQIINSVYIVKFVDLNCSFHHVVTLFRV